jgi:carbon monoxide dehydrogenase subunit G
MIMKAYDPGRDQEAEQMLEARGETTINAPIELVFDFLADMRNEPKWLPGASGVRLTSDEPVGRGSVFEGNYARAGTVICIVSEHERPGRLTIHGEAKGMSFDDAITLVAADGGTRLTAVMRTEPKGLFKLMAPMMRRVIDKQFQNNWDLLKRTLDQ